MADPVTLTAASTVLSAGSQLAGGIAEDRAASYESKQLRRQANARYAQGTRDAYEASREGEIVESNAVAAMAGGGASFDAGMAERVGEIREVSDYNALAALYDAETESRGIRAQARQVRKSGQRALASGVIRAGSTALDGASKIFGPKKP